VNYAHLLSELTIFVLAVFVGVEVISKVPPTLHTPLMSATNAIHGIVLVGALLIAVVAEPHLGPALSILAVFLASLNVFGGYVVTQRMLAMFRARPQAQGDAQGPVRDDLTIRLTEDWMP
jgi:NAD(P) transhydrogenase subunit alpha